MERKDFSIFGSSFLDGFSLAGFLKPLRRPGAPTRIFTEEPPASTATFSSAVPTDVTPEELEQTGKVFARAGFDVHLTRVSSTRS